MQYPEIHPTSYMDIPDTFNPIGMCYINGCLVIVGFDPSKTFSELLVFCNENKRLLTRTNTCPHYLGSFSLMTLGIEGNECLLYGCPTCKSIRAHSSCQNANNIVTLGEGISPSIICKGPENTILVFDDNHKTTTETSILVGSIIQLRYDQGKFDTARIIPLSYQVIGMCFSAEHNIIVLLRDDMTTITGLNVETTIIAWQQVGLPFGFVTDPLTFFKDISILPDGQCVVTSAKRLFTLDTKDGSFTRTIVDFNNQQHIKAVATCQHGDHQKLAVLHETTDQTRVSFCQLRSRVYVDPHIPLEDIISDEAELETTESESESESESSNDDKKSE